MSKTDELKKLAKKITGEEPNVRRASNVVEFIADHISGDIQNTDTISDSIAYLTDVYEGGGSGSNVIIDNNVTYNSSYGFKTLITEIDLKDFTLPSSLTTLLQFLADFKNLKEIKNLTIPNNVTELNSCFTGCSSLITIPNIDTSNITRIQYCFNGCSSLENVPILDLSHITGSGLNSCFGNCPSLTNDSLHNIIKSLVNTTVSSNKRLAYIGLSSEQATICTTFDEWTTLTENGWTTGY